MSKELRRYYRGIDARTSHAYEMGRNFEYRVMAILRKHGWHCMRRFGSQGVVFCSKCHKNVSRRTMKCPKHGKASVKKASLDISAYKNGVYLLITCKFSSKHPTVYLDDEYWENLVLYAKFYEAIPVFAGNKEPPTNEIYLVDLRKLVSYDAYYRYKGWERPDDDQVSRLLAEAWEIIDRCNLMLGQIVINCPKCKSEIEIPDCSEATVKHKARWAELKMKQVNVINKLLWRSGATATEDDLAQIFEKAVQVDKKEQETTKNGS